MNVIDLGKLKEPFSLRDLEWKIQSAGYSRDGQKIWAKVLCYITARAIQERLDTVCGAENWKNEFTQAPQGGVLCGISIKVNNEWVTKWNGADNTDVEAVKGGLSNAEKRTASEWGIGRYLYDIELKFAEVAVNGVYDGSFKSKDGKRIFFKWNPPVDLMPEWALSNEDLALKRAGKSLIEAIKKPSKIPEPKKQEQKKDAQVSEQAAKSQNPVPVKAPANDMLSQMPDDVAGVFRALKFTKGSVMSFCNTRAWNWELIRKDLIPAKQTNDVAPPAAAGKDDVVDFDDLPSFSDDDIPL